MIAKEFISKTYFSECNQSISLEWNNFQLYYSMRFHQIQFTDSVVVLQMIQ